MWQSKNFLLCDKVAIAGGSGYFGDSVDMQGGDWWTVGNLVSLVIDVTTAGTGNGNLVMALRTGSGVASGGNLNAGQRDLAVFPAVVGTSFDLKDRYVLPISVTKQKPLRYIQMYVTKSGTVGAAAITAALVLGQIDLWRPEKEAVGRVNLGTAPTGQ